jgi:hypothetical protein
MKIQFLGSHTITLPVIQVSSTQKPEMPWKTWQPTPETNPARSLPRLCPSVTTMSKPCCPVNKTANAQFDTSVQLLQSQPPMQMSDVLKSTQQPTVPAIRQQPECRNVKNKNKVKIIIHTVTFRGIVNMEKIYCDFFSCDFCSTDATHTYDIILNIDTISILIHTVNDKQ